MMKAKVKHFKIKGLDAEFSVVTGNKLKDCYRVFDREFLDLNHKELEFSHSNAALVYNAPSSLRGDPDNLHMCTILFLPKETMGQDLRYIAHESVHAAYFIISYIGIKIDVDNHEILAKLVDYIFEKTSNFIYG